VTRSSSDDGTDTLEGLTSEIVSFAKERDWSKFHDPKNLTMAIASEAGELAAILRWTPTQEADRYCAETKVRERLLLEIGDVGILMLLLCERLGIDFVTTVRAKLEINERNYPIHKARGRAERDDE
jgi:dCTP diphosphatase